MKQNQKGFGSIEILLMVIVLALIGGVAWWVWQGQSGGDSSKTVKTNTEQSKVTATPKSGTTGIAAVDEIMKGVDYKLLDVTAGSACSDKRDACYSGKTAFFQLPYNIVKDVKQVGTNLAREKWLSDDGRSASSWLESNTTSDNMDDASDQENLFDKPGANQDYGYWSYFNLGLFGVDQAMYRGKEGLQFFAFSKEELQTNEEPYYVIQSNLTVDYSYDFSKLLSKLDANSYILAITYGTKN